MGPDIEVGSKWVLRNLGSDIVRTVLLIHGAYVVTSSDGTAPPYTWERDHFLRQFKPAPALTYFWFDADADTDGGLMGAQYETANEARAGVRDAFGQFVLAWDNQTDTLTVEHA